MNNIFKKVGKYFAIIFLFIASLFPTLTFNKADSFSTNQITNLITNINVNENFTFNVSVHIDAKINYSHGIYATIPYNDAEDVIKNVKVTSSQLPHEIKKEFNPKQNLNIVKIQFGSSSKYVSGAYSFDYTYTIEGTPEASKAHNLVLNVIPSYWDMPINYAKTTVTMPKPVEWGDNLEVYTGSANTQNLIKDNSNYHVNTTPTTFEIEATNLHAQEGASIRETLPNDYWQGVKYIIQIPDIIFITCVSVFIITILCWYKWGRDKKPIPVVQFYPPDGIGSVEAGYYFDAEISNEDILSMMIQFVDRGYAKLTKDENGNDGFEYVEMIPSDRPMYEQALFTAMFKVDTNNNVNRKMFSANCITSKFLQTFVGIRLKLRQELGSVFDTTSLIVRGIIIAILIIMAIIYVGYLNIKLEGLGTFIMLLTPFIFLFSNMFSKYSAHKTKVKTLASTSLLLILWILAIWFSVVIFKNSVFRMVEIGVAIFLFCVSVLMAQFIKRRDERYLKRQGDLLGFRQFIETAELPRIETLVMQDPQYFIKTLPYAYAFGLTDKWISQFKQINPDIYDLDLADVLFLETLLDDIDDTCIRVKEQSSSSFSGSSGGGSHSSSFGSGSGFGGGGGGSW